MQDSVQINAQMNTAMQTKMVTVLKPDVGWWHVCQLMYESPDLACERWVMGGSI